MLAMEMPSPTKTRLHCGHRILNEKCLHCKSERSHWYQKAKDSGFQDIERDDLYLHKFTGLTEGFDEAQESWGFLDRFAHQPAAGYLISSWPEGVFSQEEAFLHHSEFDELCETLCGHGNNSLSPNELREIWAAYCEGKSHRGIAQLFDVSDTAIFRAIKKITEWMHIMEDQESDLISEESCSVILRPVNWETDSPLIFASWRNNLWYSKNRDEKTRNQFYSAATRSIRKLISKPEISVRVACIKENPDQIIGFSVVNEKHLEWIYVKLEYREKGVGNLLTKHISTFAEPVTFLAKKLTQLLKLPIKRNENESERE